MMDTDIESFLPEMPSDQRKIHMTEITPITSTGGKDDSNMMVFNHDWRETDELVSKIVVAVAKITDKDEMAIEQIHSRIEPDSLNRLFSQAETDRDTRDALLVFSLEECTVTVYGSGVVTVQG